MDLETYKQKRQLTRRATDKIVASVEGGDELQADAIEVLLEQLIAKENSLKLLDHTIESLVRREDLRDEWEGVEKYDELIIKVRTRCAQLLRSGSGGSSNCRYEESVGPIRGGRADGMHAVRLPKLEIRRFDGEICKFLEFWEQFDVAVHSNPSLSGVQKFIYLKSLLSGPANSIVSGLQLSEANYGKAVELVRERYGRKDVAANAHMKNLLRLSPIRKASDTFGLRRLYDYILVQIRGLESLGCMTADYGCLLSPVLLEAFPEEIILAWTRSCDPRDINVVSGFLDFVKREVEGREASRHSSAGESFRVARDYPGGQDTRRPRYSTTSLHVSKSKCGLCLQPGHSSTGCSSIIGISEKRENLRKNGLCYICLSSGHVARNCPTTKLCSQCSGRHHTKICQAHLRKEITKDADGVHEPPLVAGTSVPHSLVLLQTARAVIHCGEFNEEIRCLFDGGSQRSFIRRECSRKLGLYILGEENMPIETFGGNRSDCKRKRNVVVPVSDIHHQNSVDIEAWEVDNICASKLEIPGEVAGEFRKRGFNLADAPLTKEEANRGIELLIGSDCYWRFVTGKVIPISAELSAVETIFGWTLQGPVPSEMLESSTTLMTTADAALDSQLRAFWEVESAGISPKGEEETDHEQVEQFMASLSFADGRYCSKLLWKAGAPELKSNYMLAKIRLLNLLRRLERDPELFTQYEEIIHSYVKEGIAERIEINSLDSRCFYLPHHCVVRASSTTTRIRVVFDASAKDPMGVSLNDRLHPGPNLNPDLVKILLRFRLYRYGFSADIEKAFLQIGLCSGDQDAVRFLWVEIQSGKRVICCFRMKRVLFGVNCSPFILAAVLRTHLNRMSRKYPKVEGLSESFYVDDLLSGGETLEDVKELCETAKHVFTLAGMNLRKWRSNSMELLSYMGETEVSEKILDTSGVFKVLGLVWRVEADCIGFSLGDVVSAVEGIVSKRSILSASARVFDPLGFICPFVVRIKVLLQVIWGQQCDWDDHLPNDIVSKWNEWRDEIALMNNISIPRRYFTFRKDHMQRVELHTFVDACSSAYAAAVYIRSVSKIGEICCNLMIAKARVAPLKPLTIPRLELMAALIGARLCRYVCMALDLKVELNFWSDSTVALSWIKGDAQRWKPFVSNRVLEIQSLSTTKDWRHVPGVENPADLACRGLRARSLVTSQTWWSGPHWLSKERSRWPGPSNEVDELLVQQERRKVLPVVAMAAHVELMDWNRYGTFLKVVRVIAYMWRFIRGTRCLRSQSVHLRASEIIYAKRTIVGLVQTEVYGQVIEALKKGRTTDISLFSKLRPFIDEYGLLRVGGRIGNATVERNIKHPLIMPRDHHVSELLIRDCHERLCHTGVKNTWTEVREMYWVLSGRQLTKKIIRRCVICQKLDKRGCDEIQSPLPSSRIESSMVFKNVGVDFSGPFSVRDERGIHSAYILIVTCAVVRAVHLEVLPDITADSFLLAFRKFVARRGLPSVVYSDNAQAFKRAKSELHAAFQCIEHKSVRNFFSSHQIDWRFIAQCAPWWGGFYERLIRCVKSSMSKVIGRAVSTFVEAGTVLAEIEATLNSRPLTYIYDEVGIEGPLTPAHFLVGDRLTSLPPATGGLPQPTKNNLIRRYRYREALVEGYWKRWRREYLVELREFSKSRSGPVDEGLSVGDIVLVSDTNAPRLHWKMGRVDRLFQGNDGRVRTAEIYFGKGRLTCRPVQLLCKVEI